jgi:hypothetical protein
MAPAWDKLGDEFADSKTVIIASVAGLLAVKCSFCYRALLHSSALHIIRRLSAAFYKFPVIELHRRQPECDV